jgi:hypothetical protein
MPLNYKPITAWVGIGSLNLQDANDNYHLDA